MSKEEITNMELPVIRKHTPLCLCLACLCDLNFVTQLRSIDLHFLVIITKIEWFPFIFEKDIYFRGCKKIIVTTLE